MNHRLFIAGVFVWIAASGVFWTFICSPFGRVAAVDTHFTSRPQDHPEFRLSPWTATPPPSETGEGRAQPLSALTREAVWPIDFYTLRYTQRTLDDGATVDTIAYQAEVRWGRVLPAAAVTVLLPPSAAVVTAYLIRRRRMAGGQN